MNASARPSLHEIAAMPFPASQNAMRQFYDPKWGTEDASDGKRRFKVSAEYTYTVSADWTDVVEAESVDEAKEIAREEISDEAPGEDVEISAWKVEEIEA